MDGGGVAEEPSRGVVLNESPFWITFPKNRMSVHSEGILMLIGVFPETCQNSDLCVKSTVILIFEPVEKIASGQILE